MQQMSGSKRQKTDPSNECRQEVLPAVQKIQEIREYVNELEKCNIALNQQFEELQKRFSEIEQSDTDLRQQVEELHEGIIKVGQSNIDLNQQNEELHKIIEEKDQALSFKDNAINGLQVQVADQENTIKMLQEQLAQQRKTNEEITHNHQIANEAWKEEYAKVHVTNSMLEQTVREMNQELESKDVAKDLLIASLENQLAAQDQKYQKIHKEQKDTIDILNVQVYELKEEIKDLKVRETQPNPNYPQISYSTPLPTATGQTTQSIAPYSHLSHFTPSTTPTTRTSLGRSYPTQTSFNYPNNSAEIFYPETPTSEESSPHTNPGYSSEQKSLPSYGHQEEGNAQNWDQRTQDFSPYPGMYYSVPNRPYLPHDQVVTQIPNPSGISSPSFTQAPSGNAGNDPFSKFLNTEYYLRK